MLIIQNNIEYYILLYLNDMIRHRVVLFHVGICGNRSGAVE